MHVARENNLPRYVLSYINGHELATRDISLYINEEVPTRSAVCTSELVRVTNRFAGTLCSVSNKERLSGGLMARFRGRSVFARSRAGDGVGLLYSFAFVGSVAHANVGGRRTAFPNSTSGRINFT